MTLPKIGLTVLGGFLGAGKTTLLNRLLRDAGERRLAVLVNDFGAINVDAELIESRDGDMLRLTNGCICCGLGGDFIAALAYLRDYAERPEQVIVEASGIADPGPIAAYGDIPGYRQDAVVVVADAETVQQRADDDGTRLHVRGQLREADLVVLNKIDLVGPDELAATRGWLREVTGPSTAIVATRHGDLPVDVVLGARERTLAGHPPRAAHPGDEREHPGYETWSWSSPTPLSGEGLVEAVRALPDGLLRAKGLLYLREDPANRYLMQLVGRRGSILCDRPWGSEERASRLVMIGLPGSIREHDLNRTLTGLTAA
jgi:G3E family GTPase